MRKKAQIQNMETITVVIIVIILIVLGIVYAANQRAGKLEKEKERTQDLQAIEITTNTLNMDFVKCSQAEAGLDVCVDYHKIKALANNTFKEENYLYFYRLFGDAEITLYIHKNITQPTLIGEEIENITIFKVRELENVTTIPISTPVIVKNAPRNLNYFAIMEVKTFR